MVRIRQSETRNRLLAALAPDAFDRLAPHLERTALARRRILVEAEAPVERVFFVEAGIVSILAGETADRVGVGLIGPEGAAGLTALLGAGRSPETLMVEVPGEALVLSAEALRTAFEEREGLRPVLLGHVRHLMVQAGRTAYANARLGIEARLARWILMVGDRLGGGDLPLTHEALATMLGTRRSGVTAATHVLEGDGLIQARRGHLVLRDRRRLEALAGEAYVAAEAARRPPPLSRG